MKLHVLPVTKRFCLWIDNRIYVGWTEGLTAANKLVTCLDYTVCSLYLLDSFNLVEFVLYFNNVLKQTAATHCVEDFLVVCVRENSTTLLC